MVRIDGKTTMKARAAAVEQIQAGGADVAAVHGSRGRGPHHDRVQLGHLAELFWTPSTSAVRGQAQDRDASLRRHVRPVRQHAGHPGVEEAIPEGKQLIKS